MNTYFVYMLATRRNGTLYTGVTSELTRRVSQHKMHRRPGFTSDYDVTRLVWFETHDDVEHAIRREKRVKRWRREWKLQLIETSNPTWRDLYDDLFAPPGPL